MSDYITSLPVDNSPISKQDSEIINSLIQPVEKHPFASLLDFMKNPLLGAFLFVLLSVSPVTSLLHDIMPYTASSEAASLLVRFIVFIVLFIFFQSNS